MGFFNAEIRKEELHQGRAESHILHTVTTEQWSVSYRLCHNQEYSDQLYIIPP
jgi:hypothetical protein